MPVIPAAGALIGLTGTAGFIAGSAIVGAAIGGVTSALAGGKIGKGMLLGGLTGAVGGYIGAPAAATTSTGNAVAGASTAVEGSTIASGGMGGQVIPGITANAANPVAAGGGLLKPIAPSLGNIAPSVSGSGSTTAASPIMSGSVATPTPAPSPIDPTVAAQQAIIKGQMLSGAAQGAGSYFSGKEAAESAAKIADKQIEARRIKYNGAPGLLGAQLTKEWQAPRRATFNRETGRWEYAPAN